MANHIQALVGVGEDLLAKPVANAVQAARQGDSVVCVGVPDLGVVVIDPQTLGCFDQDDWLQGIAPAHGLIANVGALFAVNGVDAELQLIIGGAVLAEAHEAG